VQTSFVAKDSRLRGRSHRLRWQPVKRTPRVAVAINDYYTSGS